MMPPFAAVSSKPPYQMSYRKIGFTTASRQIFNHKKEYDK